MWRTAVVLAVFVEMGFVRCRLKSEILCQKLAEVDAAVGGLGEDFDAVAGAQNHAFADAGDAKQLLQSVGQIAIGDGEALTDFDGRRLVVHADELKVHGLASA